MIQLDLQPPNWEQWVPITKTRNFVLNDPLLDWLDLYGTGRGYKQDFEDPSYIAEADFAKFVSRKGNEFESCVLRLLNDRLKSHGLDGIDIPESGSVYSREVESVKRTLSTMAEGKAAIAQAALWNPENQTYGTVDLLIRSDYIHLLCENVAPYDANVPAPLISQPFHYIAVEIKFRSFKLASNYEADNTAEPHKVQLALYNEALGVMQGYRPRVAYFIGRGWEKGSGDKHERVRNCLHSLIPVTLPLQPQHGKKPPINWTLRGLEAVSWIRRVRTEGANWTVVPPTIHELRPCMKNRKDDPWHKTKGEIAEAIGEPTKIWQVGLEDRRQLIAAGHGDCSLSSFDVSIVAPSTGDTDTRIRTMVRINQDSAGPEFIPSVISWNRTEWSTPASLEFYVDFETASNLDDNFSQLPEQGGQPLIFMIGCGHYTPIDGDYSGDWIYTRSRRQWNFRVFTTPDLSEKSEKEIILQWYGYMRDVRNSIPGAPERPQVFHWSPAETRTYSIGSDSAFERHLRPTGWPEINWYDYLGRVVKPSKTADAFFVRGAWGFGLKSVAKALYKLGHIQTDWQDGPADGLAAMSGSWTCYHIAKQLEIPVEDVVLSDRSGKEHRLFQEIVEYNEVDCKTMAEAIQFIRSC